MIALVVLLQRLVVPVGSTPVQLTLLVGLAAVGLLLLSRRLVVDRLRLELYALAAIACLVVTVLGTVTGASPSITSLVLLLVLYLPWVLKAGPGHLGTLHRVASGFVDLMLVLALVGVAQLVAQLLGLWTYQDYLAEILPPGYLSDSYNTNIPLAFGSAVYKANAFVFLEPSFLSQFAALGAIVAVVLRAPAWKVLGLVAGVFAAVSGTGIILLLVGGVLILFRAPRLIRPLHVVALGAVAVGVLLSPVAPLLMDRVGETSEVGSSGYLRFVQPYGEVAGGLADDGLRYAIGAGAGSVERLLPAQRGDELGQAVVYPILPKVVFEYGLIAGGLVVLFIVVAMLDRGAWRVVPGASLFMVFVLSGALLQPHTAFVVWALTGLWTAQRGQRLDRVPTSFLRRRRWPAEQGRPDLA